VKYRKFGKLDLNVSVLGMGCMRLPTTDGISYSPNVIEGSSIELIRHAIDKGVNYLDTGYPYHGGNSEVVLGKALKDGYRKKVKVATKSPMMMVRKPEDFDNFLSEQLKRLQLDHIDFYLLHGIGRKTWKMIKEMDIISKAEAAVRDGRIGHIGFSFHDDPKAFIDIIDGYDKWEFCQVQYNYMDTEHQAGTKGVQYAASKGIPVIVMEPLLGGRISNPPAEVRKIFDGYGTKRSPAEWALQWVWDQTGVTFLLSGMSNMEQLEENLKAADELSTKHLSAKDMELISRVRAEFLKRVAIPCTKCGYCMPCPQGVNIPGVFELYNNGVMYDNMIPSRFSYGRFFQETERASACIKCGQCEEKCPQGIKISELMPMIHEKLGASK
jgi:uncharacterized protein